MTSPAPPARHGLGDPRIPWVVLLDVGLTTGAPSPGPITEALRGLAADAGWAAPSSGAVTTGARRDLLTALATDSADVLRVGLHERGLVLAARHDALDGLGMLAALGRLLGTEVRSGARGIDPARLGAGGAGALASRLWEVAARPQARVATAAAAPRPGDAFASVTVAGAPRTADLVRAGARAVATWNRGHGMPGRRVTVAVGVSTVGGSAQELADRSAFLRLRGVEELSLAEVRDRLAHAPVQPGGRGPAGGVVAAVAGVAVRLAAPRLGSTLLVSHLGELTAPEDVVEAAFYPVTGGGSGLSLGAATLRGRTTITARARAARLDDESLHQVLALVVEQLA